MFVATFATLKQEFASHAPYIFKYYSKLVETVNLPIKQKEVYDTLGSRRVIEKRDESGIGVGGAG
jgi:hypothetical protein